MLLGIAVWLCFAFYTGNTLEDALITFRYSENILAGKGFVFNPGEQVLGTTTPLLTILLAIGGFVFGTAAIPIFAKIMLSVMGLLAGLATCYVIWRAGFRFFTGIVFLVLFLSHPIVMMTSTGGMETPLVLGLMAGSLLFFQARKDMWAGGLLALLTLTRIDGLIWTGLLFLAMTLRERQVPWRAALVFGLVWLPWGIFSLVYFGTLLPNSLVAKQIVGADPRVMADPTIVSKYINWLISGINIDGTSNLALAWGLACPLGIVGIVAKRAVISNWLIVAFPIAFGLAMFIGRAPTIFEWYLVPMTWSAIILGAIGIGEIISLAFLKAKSIPRMLIGVILAGVVLVNIGMALASANTRSFENWRTWQANEDGLRKRVGEWLAANTKPDALVAMEAIGYQGYYSQRRVLDLAGLTSPAVVDIWRESRSSAESFRKIITRLHPDYVVLRSMEVDNNSHFHGGRLFDSAMDKIYFASNYAEVARFQELPVSVIPLLTIYERRVLPQQFIEKQLSADLALSVALCCRSAFRGDDNLLITTFGKTNKQFPRDTVLAFRLRDEQSHEWMLADRLLTEGFLPIDAVPEQGTLGDEFALRLPPTLPSGNYDVTVQLAGGLLASESDEIDVGKVAIVKNKGSFTATDLWWIENRLLADFAEMRLLGYAPMRMTLSPGEVLSIGLYWRARNKPQSDYLVKVQLRDASGKVTVEQSARPANNTYPTLQWDAGEVLLDWHDVLVPASLVAGEYTIQVVLVDAPAGEIVGEIELPKISVVR